MDTDTRHDEDHGFDDGAPPAFNEQAWASASPLPAMDAATRAANVASAREKDTRLFEGWADDFVSACICLHVWEQMHATPGALIVALVAGKCMLASGISRRRAVLASLASSVVFLLLLSLVVVVTMMVVR